MQPSPSLLMALVVILCLFLAVALIVLGLVWSRVRELPSQTARLLDELALRQDTLESSVARIESYDSGRANSGADGKTPENSALPRWSAPGRRLDAPEPTASGGPTLIAVPNLAAPSTEVLTSASAALNRRFGPIWDLFDAGASPEEIARRTGQPIGQVELILALRRQLSATTPGARA